MSDWGAESLEPSRRPNQSITFGAAMPEPSSIPLTGLGRAGALATDAGRRLIRSPRAFDGPPPGQGF